VDDGSTDDSLEIVKGFQKNHSRGTAIRLISHDQNLGVSAARNRIIEEASGFFLYFMDADDVIAENAISLLMHQLQLYQAEIAFGSYEKTETSGLKSIYQYPEIQLFEEDDLANFSYRKFGGIQASACNYLVKLSVLREHHLRFVDVNYWEDLVFTFDLVTYIHRAVLISQITYYYQCRENSLSNYQTRQEISKVEILNNVKAIDVLKTNTQRYSYKPYYPKRCYVVMMTYFYMVCNILKRGKHIHPPFTYKEIKSLMSHPATFKEICSFQHARFKNLLLFLIGKLPSFLCVETIRCLGKMKKLI
jgi:glycosyltransferase involved in cell wall biosynthesis